MVVAINNKCIKMRLPNGKEVDILPNVFKKMNKWIQVFVDNTEAGGFVVGYQHKITGNISLVNVSCPFDDDIRERDSFTLKDKNHVQFLSDQEKIHNYYMGIWHTHPQNNPIPSKFDWYDWYKTLKTDKTACEYIFFIIVGINETRVWIGDMETQQIEEIFECRKEGEFYKEN